MCMNSIQGFSELKVCSRHNEGTEMAKMGEIQLYPVLKGFIVLPYLRPGMWQHMFIEWINEWTKDVFRKPQRLV